METNKDIFAELNDEYLGNDNRSLQQIIEEDMQALQSIKVSIEKLVEKMIAIRDYALQELEKEINIKGDLFACAEEARGVLSCPLCGKPVKKTNVILTNRLHNIKITFSDMNIHLIKEHHFFEGKGSKFRIEPLEIARMLFDKQDLLSI